MNAVETRAFSLGDVLSVTTGRLVSRRHMDGIYDVLNFLTGDNLFTHQLPRAMDVCRPAVVAQHPTLPQTAPEFDDPDAVFAWLDEQERTFGATVELTPVAEWQSQNPIEELCDLVGPERVWVFPIPEAANGQANPVSRATEREDESAHERGD